MSLSAGARVKAAQIRVEAARLELAGHTSALRALVHRRRATLIVGAGLATGMAAGLMPVRAWARAGALIGGIGALVARSVLTPMIAGALIARQERTPERRADA